MPGFNNAFTGRVVWAILIPMFATVPCVSQEAPKTGTVQDLVDDFPDSTSAPPKRLPLEVTYLRGSLSIDTDNASLADVLKAIAAKTGAVIDIPAGAGLERVVVHLAPAPADNVLTSLLNGSRYNFLIMHSSRDTHELSAVRLIADSTSEPWTTTTAELQATEPGTEPSAYGGVTYNPGDDDPSESDQVPIPVAEVPDSGTGPHLSSEQLDQMQKERLRQRQLKREQPADSQSSN